MFEYLRKTRRRRKRRGGSDRCEGALVSVGRSHRISQSPSWGSLTKLGDGKKDENILCVYV